MKSYRHREIKCDFCHRLLNPEETLDNWQPYALIDPSNVWYEVLACPDCKDAPKNGRNTMLRK